MSPSTLPRPLPEDGNGKGNLKAIQEKTHQGEPEKEQTVEYNKPSTMGSSSVDGVDNGTAEEKAADERPKPDMEYPKGLEALSIMVALVLSITLVSLDQVSPTAPTFS